MLIPLSVQNPNAQNVTSLYPTRQLLWKTKSTTNIALSVKTVKHLLQVSHICSRTMSLGAESAP
jgi:hypothetical protein